MLIESITYYNFLVLHILFKMPYNEHECQPYTDQIFQCHTKEAVKKKNITVLHKLIKILFISTIFNHKHFQSSFSPLLPPYQKSSLHEWINWSVTSQYFCWSLIRNKYSLYIYILHLFIVYLTAPSAAQIIQNVQKLMPKIFEVISFKNKMKMAHDKMPFNAPVSSKTFLNLRNVPTSHFKWQYTNLDFQCQGYKRTCLL
jgi:hypothetical protein